MKNLNKLFSILIILCFAVSPLLLFMPTVKAADATALHVDGNQLKNASEEVVYLRGVNDDSYWHLWEAGTFGSSNYYNTVVVDAMLAALAADGINCIRHQTCVETWLDNPIVSSNLPDLHARDMFLDYMQRADSYGIYVIFTEFTARHYPYHDYDRMAYGSWIDEDGQPDLLATQQDWIDFLINRTTTLDAYDNFIPEFWNEPIWFTAQGATDFQSNWNAVLDQLRDVFHSLVIVQFSQALVTSWGDPEAGYMNLNWWDNYGLTDPDSNMMLGFHLYLDENEDDVQEYPISYSALETCYNETFGIYDLSQTIPMICNEFGCHLWRDAADEATWFTNTLNIFNDWNISYTPFSLGNYAEHRYNLVTIDATHDRWDVEWNTIGDIVVAAIAAGGVGGEGEGSWQKDYWFWDGFETGDFSAWTGTGGAPIVSSAWPYNGTYHIYAVDNAAYVYKTFSATGDLYVDFAFNVSALPSSDAERVWVNRIYDINNARFICDFGFYRQSGTVKFETQYWKGWYAQKYSTEVTPEAGVYFNVSIHWSGDDATIDFVVNGTTLDDLAVTDLSGSVTCDRVYFGCAYESMASTVAVSGDDFGLGDLVWVEGEGPPPPTPPPTPTPTPTATPQPSPTPIPSYSGIFYFRSDLYTTSNQTGYGLDTSNTDENEMVSQTNVTGTVYWGCRIFLVNNAGYVREVTAGTPIAQVNRTGDGEGYQSGTYTIADTTLTAGAEALMVKVYLKIGSGVWTVKATFITEDLAVAAIEESTLTFTLYTSYIYGTTSFSFGSDSVGSLVYGFSFTELDFWERGMYYFHTSNFLMFFLYPFTRLIGMSPFVSIIIFAIGLTVYVRFRSFVFLLLILVVLSLGGLLQFIMGDALMGFVALLCTFALAALYWKVFR